MMRHDARFEPMEPPARPIRRRRWVRWALALASLFTTLPALFAEISNPLPQEDPA